MASFMLERLRHEITVMLADPGASSGKGRSCKDTVPGRPVSYTHLDVYKRQGLFAATRP